jgi:hypothetical protein
VFRGVAAWLTDQGADMFFYYVVFNKVLLWCGKIWGPVILYVFQFAVVYASVRAYDRYQRKADSNDRRDLFGLDDIRERFNRRSAAAHWFIRPAVQTICFIVLMFSVSPFLLFLAFRRRGMHGFGWHEALVLSGMVLLKTAGWTFVHSSLWPVIKNTVIPFIRQFIGL